MNLQLCVKTRYAATNNGTRLEGWRDGESRPVSEPAEIVLAAGQPRRELVRLAIEPSSAGLSVIVAEGCRHYWRMADATLKPLPPRAALALARGDTYIALSPGAARLAEATAMARFLHLRDSFNAERLAAGVLDFLAEESGRDEFPEDVSVMVVEAR